VVRYAIRCDRATLADSADLSEFESTRYLASVPVLSAAKHLLRSLALSPLKTIKAACTALRMGLKSDTGLISHIEYFLGALILADLCEKDGVRHLHVHFGTNPAVIALLAAELSPITYSLTIHGYEEFYRSAHLSLDEKMASAAFVASVSWYGSGQLMRVSPPSIWRKIEIVRCGLDAKFLESDSPSPPTGRQFCSVGRLCAEKAQLIMVEAMAMLRDRGVDCRLVLVGDGPMRGDVEAGIARLALQDRVIITGWASGDDVKSAILSSRVLLMPSFVENLPVGIMEGLALGRPSIATFIGGIPELIVPGKNGWLIPSGSALALADAMAAALAVDDSELRDMAEACRASVRANHDVRIEAEKLKRLFGQLETACS
jgi:glycosyltransferase involved in cell wall biosynthesis